MKCSSASLTLKDACLVTHGGLLAGIRESGGASSNLYAASGGKKPQKHD